MTKEPPRKRRLLSAEELALWKTVAETTSPLEKRDASAPALTPPAAPMAPAKPKRPTHNRAAIVRPEPPVRTPSVTVHRRPTYVQSLRPAAGLDGGTARRLRKGQLPPEARIDLHGMTADRAHRALIRFILGAYSGGQRCVLVITGKGQRGRQADDGHIRAFEGGGVLKTLTPEWLASPPLGGVVVGVFQAHVRHGGDGAYYVYLRKNGVGSGG